MFSLDARTESLQLRSVRLHGAPDGLRARQRFEETLADFSPSSFNLPTRALLIVNRVAPTERLRLDRADGGVGFGQAVRMELENKARAACRPWLNPEAANAEAVLFSDETELAACLLQDWLQCLLVTRWWWPVVLEGLSAQQWWSRSLLPRGDLLPAVLANLASKKQAHFWAMRLNESEVTQATQAIITAHALASLSNWSISTALVQIREQPLPKTATDLPHTLQAIATQPRDRFSTGVISYQQLITIIPELQIPALTLPQQRLLAIALGLQRASAWTRSPAFVFALQALETSHSISNEPAALVSSPITDNLVPKQGRQAVKLCIPLAPPSSLSQENIPGIRDFVMTESLDASLLLLSNNTDPPKLAIRSIEQFDKPAPGGEGWVRGRLHKTESQKPILTIQEVKAGKEPLPKGEQDNVGDLFLSPHPDLFNQGERGVNLNSTTPFGQAIETQFGGIFYLLNVALALELYGDFTQPQRPGIALSPWDWLALVGRAWFGKAFVQDPVWKLLAELSGRLTKQEPGCDFAVSDVWLVPDEWLKPWVQVGKRPSPEGEDAATGSENLVTHFRRDIFKKSFVVSLSNHEQQTLRQAQGERMFHPKRVGENSADTIILKLYVTTKRLQIWHDAGFILADVPRIADMKPLNQAMTLYRQFECLGAVTFIRVYQRPKSVVKRDKLGRWLHSILLYLNARLSRALGDVSLNDLSKLVCCHTAKIDCTATTVDVHLSLNTLPIELRIAGLDRNPGWIPAAGRSIKFHFE